MYLILLNDFYFGLGVFIVKVPISIQLLLGFHRYIVSLR